jgi:hypothetical protein
MSLTLNL